MNLHTFLKEEIHFVERTNLEQWYWDDRRKHCSLINQEERQEIENDKGAKKSKHENMLLRWRKPKF